MSAVTPLATPHHDGHCGVRLPDAATLAAHAAEGVEEIAAARPGPLALLCEHGGNAVPAPWDDLGLPAALLASHFGYDPGAAALTQALAARLGAPAAIGRWSRLFLDLNRLDSAWECTRPDCSGIPVPGNLAVTTEDLAARLAVARSPFDAAADRAFAGRSVVLSVHTCTPVYHAHRRPWPVGVLWRERDALAAPLIDALGTQGYDPVGDNEPYDWREAEGYTLQQARIGGRTALYLEVRNDLLATDDGVAEHAARIGTALETALAVWEARRAG
jgi:predicted N-formylglutamate amidohydrolase